MIWRVVRLAAALLVATAAVVVATLAVAYLPTHHAPEGEGHFSDVEFVTIVLAAATVVLTGLAIVLALAGAVGYVTIRDASARAAREVGREAAVETATQVAREKAEEVAARTAEEIAARAIGRDPSYGDDFAQAEGRERVGDVG